MEARLTAGLQESEKRHNDKLDDALAKLDAARITIIQLTDDKNTLDRERIQLAGERDRLVEVNEQKGARIQELEEEVLELWIAGRSGWTETSVGEGMRSNLDVWRGICSERDGARIQVRTDVGRMRF